MAGLKDASTEIEPEELNEYLEIIDQESERLSRLITNLLDLSRIEAGRLNPDKGLYYLPEIIGKTIERLTRTNTLIYHPVETCFEDGLPLVPVDYLQLEQVLTNLLENAVKYSQPGKGITLKVCQAPRPVLSNPALSPSLNFPDNPLPMGLLVEVSDSGVGIPLSDLELIFEKFYRTGSGQRHNSTSLVPGSGLGLAICKGIIEAHEGQIWARNKPGGGTVFSFWLPAKPGFDKPFHSPVPEDLNSKI